MKLANRRNPTSPKGQKGKFKTMFNKIKNLFKNSKRNQIKKLSLIVEELRQENDARASEIYALKKALQECQDNQENANENDIEELQSKCDEMQDTLDNMPDFEDIESRIDDLESKCNCIDDYFDPDDKADVCEVDDLDRRLTRLGERIEQVEEKQTLEDVGEVDAKISQLKQIKSELKTMFEKIVNALED